MLLFLFIVASFMTTLCYEVEEGLVTVVAIFRHGDRTPIRTYATDPYRNASLWPVGFGQLTNIGKMQHFLLGQWLRNRYINFLPSLYSETDVYIRSTDVDRTLMSVEANLAGLFPPQEAQIWNNELTWQPIPIHTTPEQLDNVLAMKLPCNKYALLIDELKSSIEFKKIEENNQDLYKYLTEHSKEKINSLESLLYLYDTLMIESRYNFTLPDWTTSVFPHQMDPWAKFAFAVACYTPELARLKIGPLINDIQNYFTKSIKNEGYKLVVYSAHDVTVANILNALQLFDYHCPPYAATILFELRLINDNYFVNIVYKNSTDIQNLTLKDCPFYCPLDKFNELLKPLSITPEQWKSECQVNFFSNTSYTVFENGIFLVGFAFLMLLGICIMVGFILRSRNTREQMYVRLNDEDNVYN